MAVMKKDRIVRICQDARFLNSKMTKDYVSSPAPEELLSQLKSGQVLSTVDLTSGYWRVPIRHEDRKYTGFMFENHTYCFQVLPFGLSTSVASFIRCINKILGPESENFIFVYVDDILVFSRNVKEHFEHLSKLFRRFRECNLTIKLRKCRFARQRVEFLGHIISAEGVQVDEKRVKAIMEILPPRNIRELRGFLGVINYERRLCHNFSRMTLPLLRLLKKGTPWSWGESEQSAFEQINFISYNGYLPNFDEAFFIQTDSSRFAVGAYLYQLDETNVQKIIAFASRTLRGAEINYTITEKEALANIFALKQWRTLVLGRKLYIVTDHKSLSFLMQTKLGSSRLTR